MKKIFLCALCALFSTVSTSSAGVFKIPNGLIEQLDSGKCARVSGIGKIQFLYSNGLAIGKDNDGNVMRFMPQSSPKKLPFKGLMLAKSGKRLVTVSSCDNVEGSVVEEAPVKRSITKQPVKIQESVTSFKSTPPPTSIQKSVAVPKPISSRVGDVVQSGSDSSGSEKAQLLGFHEMIHVANVTAYSHQLINSGDKEQDGHGVNFNVHIRPIRSGQTDVGGYFEFVDGVSKMHESRANLSGEWKYQTVGGGISTRTKIGNTAAFEVNVGLLHQKTDGSMSNGYWSHQSENQLDLRVKYDDWSRRDANELWWPYQEAGARFVYQLNADYRDSNGNGDESAWDNSWLHFFYNIDIYDFYVGEDKDWRWTPALDTSTGYLWGPENGYFGLGLGLGLAYDDNEILDFRPLHLRLNTDGDWTLYNSVTIEAANMWFAWNASRTEAYSDPE